LLSYIGKLIIDQIVQISHGKVSSSSNQIWKLVIIEFILAILSDVLNRAITLMDSLLGDLFSTLERIDEDFLEGFKEYLGQNVSRRGEGKISANSTSSYFNKVRSAICEAYQKKMIKDNPCNRVKGIKGEETRRQYLTLEELQKMAATPCNIEKLKQSFLFSALTGFRWSDVKKLTWDKINYSENDGWSIQFTQQKTKNIETMPVSDQAIKILGVRKENEKEIFEGLMYNTWMNDQLKKWVTAAGINKKITFHCARHSFATLHLSMNTDIYCK